MENNWNLSEKRKELFEKELVGNANGGRIYRKILKQDREFIRLLKNNLCRENEPAPKDCTCWACGYINALAGEELK